jgi:hypothetical protein
MDLENLLNTDQLLRLRCCEIAAQTQYPSETALDMYRFVKAGESGQEAKTESA